MQIYYLQPLRNVAYTFANIAVKKADSSSTCLYRG